MIRIFLIILALFWAALLLVVPAHATTTEVALEELCPGREYLAPHVDAAARRYLLHPVLLVAVMRTESHCRMDVVGRAGERCAFQVRGVARNGRSNAELRDPATCIDTGARWLAMMLTWANGLSDGLGAYNTGKKGHGKRYARKVLAYLARAWRAIEAKGRS
jgi:soluble lytic murein transglycosylase-like protein